MEEPHLIKRCMNDVKGGVTFPYMISCDKQVGGAEGGEEGGQASCFFFKVLSSEMKIKTRVAFCVVTRHLCCCSEGHDDLTW